MKKTRRTFIKQSVYTAASAGLLGTLGTSACAPSDTVNIALIGCNNRGIKNLTNHLDLPDVRCIAMCDVDNNILEERADDIQKKYQQKPRLYRDFRKLLENKDIDAVIIGTPDHWHCLPMIYACEAGKDVYVEKPMANSIQECNLMVKAALRYDRVVQVGQQQRSGKHWIDIMDTIKSGKLGKLRKVVAWANFNGGIGSKRIPDESVPNGLDYDFWLGPAPLRNTFNTNRFHGNWRYWWNYGGGLMTDWGVHLLDMALWAGDVEAAPKEVLSYGDNISYPDHAREVYDTMSVIYPLDDYVISWEHTAGTQSGPYGLMYGLRFVCDNASVVANRAGYNIIPEHNRDVEAFKSPKGPSNHLVHAENFIDCIKSREETACPPKVGRQVALYAHMANIAARTGESKLEWDDVINRFTNSEKANSFIVPEYRNPWSLPKL